jgi:hypothetical protein
MVQWFRHVVWIGNVYGWTCVVRVAGSPGCVRICGLPVPGECRISEMRAYRGTAVPVWGWCGNRAKSWGAPRLNNRHGGLAERQAEMGVSSDRMNVNRAMPAHGRRSTRA